MKRLLLLIFLLAPVAAFSQGSVYSTVVLNRNGQPLAGANVAICTNNPGSTPVVPPNCTLASTYSDVTLTTQCTAASGLTYGTGCANPGMSDSFGNVIIWGNPGVYYMQVYGQHVNTYVLPIQLGGSGGGGSSFALVSNPSSAATNTIVPTVNNIPSLVQKCPTGSSPTQIAYQITDGSNNNIYSITCGGQVTILNGAGGTITAGDLFGSLQVVPFTANETFNASGTMAFKTTLTGNVTSSSLTNIPSSSYGKEIAFIICQDSAGSHTFAWPANVIGAPTVPTTASQCNGYIGVTDGVNAYIQTGSSTGGASGITSAAQTTNQIAKFTSSSANGTAGNSTIYESGTLPNITIPRQSNMRHSEYFNWSQTPGGSISSGSNTVTLTPQPYGIDPSFPDYYVYLQGGTGTAEAVLVTGTTCAYPSWGSGSCTITFTAQNSHTGAWTVGSASTGLQEAIQDAQLTFVNGAFIGVEMPCYLGNNNTPVNLYAPVETHGNRIYIGGNGCAKVFQNFNWGPAFVVGDRTRGGAFFFNTLDSFTLAANASTGQPKINAIQSLSRTGCPASCVVTIQTTAAHDFTAADVALGVYVFLGGYLNDNTFAGEYKVLSVPDTTHLTVTGFSSSNPSTVYAGGWVVKEYVPFVDNLLIHGVFNHINFTTANTRWMQGLTALVDQAMYVNGLDNQGSGQVLVVPTDSYRGAMIYAPGPNNPNGAVGFINGLDCSLQGAGDCINWESGDDLFITDSIIQGFCDVGIRMSLRRGGGGALTAKGVHYESGGCGSGFSLKTTAPIVSNGAQISNIDATNSGPALYVPFYGTSGDGLQQWFYYVQAVSSTSDTMCSTQPPDATYGATDGQRCAFNFGNGPLMFAGYAAVDSVSPGTVSVKWFTAPGATSYNVYRVTGVSSSNTQTAPFGTGNYLVQSAVNPLTSCTDSVCTITDPGTTPSSTTIATYGIGSYFPYFPLWPASVFLGTNGDNGGGSAIPAAGQFVGTIATGSPTYMISEEIPGQDTISLMNSMNGVLGPSPAASVPTRFKSFGNQNPSNATPLPGFAQFRPAKIGFIGQTDNSSLSNRKGINNYTPFITVSQVPFSINTLFDSNFQKTLATASGRPSNDTGDCEDGIDHVTTGIGDGYYIRCGKQIDFYINSLATGTSVFQINSSGVLGAVNNASGVVYHVDGHKYSSLCSLVTSTIPINTAATIYEDILETNITCDPFNQSRIIRLFLAPQVSPYTWNVPLRIGSNEILAGSVQAFGSGTATHGTEVRPGTSYANPYVSTLPSGFTIAATTTGCGGVFPAAGTYLIEVSWGPDTTRETLPALETSVTVDGATQCFKVTHPASPPANVTNYDVYGCATAGCTSGQEFWQGQSAIGSDFTYSSFQSGSGKPVTINNTGAFIVVGNQNGPAANATAANNFDAKVQDLSINCIGDSTISGGYNGTVAAAILTGEEGSGLFRVDAKNCPGVASYIWEAYSTGLGGSNSRMVDITGNLGSSGDAHTNPTVAELYVDNMTTSRGVDGFTFQPSASTTPVCIEVNTNFGGTAGGFGILNGHMEHCTDGALFTQQGQGTVINATCSPSSVTNCVHVTSTGGNVAVMGVRGGATATILDESQSPSFSTTAGYVPLWSNFTMSKSVQTFGSVPTCTATGIGTGGSPGCALATGSNSQNGTMNITTGSAATAANGTISLIFPGTGFGVHGNSCTYRLLNVTAGGTWDPRATLIGSLSGTGHDDSLWDNNASNLTVSKQYSINYTCGSN